jgi:hypothetical protein
VRVSQTEWTGICVEIFESVEVTDFYVLEFDRFTLRGLPLSKVVQTRRTTRVGRCQRPLSYRLIYPANPANPANLMRLSVSLKKGRWALHHHRQDQ